RIASESSIDAPSSLLPGMCFSVCLAKMKRVRVSPDMLSSYNRDGFLLLTDAVDRKTAERARLALMAQIPREHGNPHHVFSSHSAVLACFNKEVCSAAAVLAGSRKRFPPPPTSYTVSVFPTSGPWR